MSVIIGYIIIIGIWRLILYDNKYNARFTLLAGGLLFFIAASRSIEFGSDVIGYVKKYDSLVYKDFSIVLNDFLSGNGKDPFFYFFSKVISLTGANYQVWIAILSGIFVFSVSRIIAKESPYPFISFISLLSLGYFYFSLSGLRQTMALSFVILSYPFLKERRLRPFLLTIVIGSLFHSSALIFLLSYPVVKMKIGYKYAIFIGAALSASLLFRDFIRQLVGILGWTDTLADYAFREVGLSYSGFIIQLTVFIFCLLYKNKVLAKDQANLALYNLLFLGLIFQTFASTIAEFFRISMYFSVFSVILIPKAISSENDKELRKIVYYLVFCALSAYWLRSNNFSGFEFFWK